MKKIISSIILIASISYASGVKPVDNQLYTDECASCHFGFQPGLLPARSWVKLMGDLENHFEDDASLDKNDVETLTQYLVKNSSDNSRNFNLFKKMKHRISKDSTPIRISETRHFKKEHRRIKESLIKQEEVKSISNCAACHTTASKGVYKERYINIPNYGKWDD